MILTQGFQITMFATSHHIKMIRAANKGNSTTTCIYQMLGGSERSLITIGRNTRKAVGQTSASKEHKGNTHIGNFLKMTIICSVLRQTGNNTFYMQTDEIINGTNLSFGIFMGVGTDHRIALLTSLILNAV